MTYLSSFADTVREVAGSFDSGQMIAIGVIAFLALLIGFMIGAIALYRAGVKKGKKQGLKDAVELAMSKAEEKSGEQIKQAVLAERQRNASVLAAKQAELSALEARLAEAEKSKAAAEQSALDAEKSKTAAEQAALIAAKSKEEAEKAKREAEKAKEQAEEAKDVAVKEALSRKQREEEEQAAKERKTKITLLSKQEILSFAEGLDEYLPASIYARGGDLPDSCRVGICTFLLVYERKGMVKLVLRLHKKTASALEAKYKLFTKAVYPKGGDWYKWILSSEVTDLSMVTAAIRMAYKYAYLSNYDEKTGEINVEIANRNENLINEAIMRYKDLPDRDFIVASDAAEGGAAAYRLYGKKEMTAYALSLRGKYPVTASESDSDLSPNTIKVGGRTFLMAYEKDGVAKMIFRMSDGDFAKLKQKHATAEISTFPKAKGYHWYVVCIDETFSSDSDIEEIIRSACAHVHGLTDKK